VLEDVPRQDRGASRVVYSTGFRRLCRRRDSRNLGPGRYTESWAQFYTIERARCHQPRDAPAQLYHPPCPARYDAAGRARSSALAGVRLRQRSGRALTQAPSPRVCNHTFRATGIALFRRAGGELRVAQRIAAHASIETTAIYDRIGDELQRDEVERVQL
jgi:integrase